MKHFQYQAVSSSSSLAQSGIRILILRLQKQIDRLNGEEEGSNSQENQPMVELLEWNREQCNRVSSDILAPDCSLYH